MGGDPSGMTSGIAKAQVFIYGKVVLYPRSPAFGEQWRDRDRREAACIKGLQVAYRISERGDYA